MFSHLATDWSFKSKSWINHLFIQVSFILSMTITGCTVVLLLWSKPTIDSYCFKSLSICFNGSQQPHKHNYPNSDCVGVLNSAMCSTLWHTQQHMQTCTHTRQINLPSVPNFSYHMQPYFLAG